MESALAGSRRAYSRVGIALFLMLALNTALQIGAQRLASSLGWQIISGSWAYYLITMAPQYLIAVPAAAAVIMRIPAAQGVGRMKLNRRQLVAAGAICIFLGYAGNLQGMLVSGVISQLAGRPMANPLVNTAQIDDLSSK
jgi:hypothetical protein